MIAKLKALFTGEEVSLDPSGDDKLIATAALLIEAACSDEDYSDEERSTISDVLKRHFSLNDKEAEELVQEAEKLHANSDQILYFTRSIKEHFPIEERIHIVEMLWEIAYADNKLCVYEANLVRRICGLIYVDDVESGKAKKRVLAAKGLSE